MPQSMAHVRPGSLGKKISPLKSTLGKIEQAGNLSPEMVSVRNVWFVWNILEQVLYELALLSQGTMFQDVSRFKRTE